MSTAYLYPMIRGLAICAVLLATVDGSHAYSLWSTASSYQRTGVLYLGEDEGALGDLTIQRLLLTGPGEWFVAFNNNGAHRPNVCGEATNGASRLVNENVSACPTIIAGAEIRLSVVGGGPHDGQIMSTMTIDGVLTMTADVELRKGAEAAVRLPLYATTGVVPIPPGLRRHVAGLLQRFPWMKSPGGDVRGRVGDFNGDGWIDGTLIASGVLPDNSPLYARQPYLLIRHFETDIPAQGVLSGDVKALQERVKQ
jgi:hypothetical protein